MKCVHIIVNGRVQGVNFRWFTKNIAQKLKIKGWVKNLFDGRVEIIAQGDDMNIYNFIKYVEKGPVLARVSNICVKEVKCKDKLKNFSII